MSDHATSSFFFSALYDGDGVRVRKTDLRAGVNTVNDFSYGPSGLLWSSNPTTIYTPGFGHRSNGVNTFYHHDWIGSTRYTSDISGNTFPSALRFDAYGNRSATGGTTYHPTDEQFAGVWGYQTEWASSTDPGLGLDYLSERYYDPVVGRFISPDPIGFGGGLNLYGYCGNNPVGLVDPLGLLSWSDVGAFAYKYRQPIGWVAGGITFVGTGGNLLAAATVAGLTTGGIAYLGNGQDLGYAAADGCLSFVVVGEGIPALQVATGVAALKISEFKGWVAARSGGTVAGNLPAVGCKGGSAGSPSFQGLVGRDFEDALQEHYGGHGSFRSWSGGQIVEFDGRTSPTDWYEAKSGGYWNQILGNPKRMSKFYTQIGEQQKTAALNDVNFKVYSNSPIPDAIKAWLTKRGVPFTELLH